MKVLYIGLPFYEYTERIKAAISKYANAEVDQLILCNCGVSIEAVIDRLSFGLFGKIKPWTQQFLFFSKHRKIQYDAIFVLTGRNLNPSLFERFIQTQKCSERILYLWDDIARLNNFFQIKGMFDRIISFDKEDCKKYTLEFLPLFYLEDYVYTEEKKTISCSILGGWHSDRVQIINRICQEFNPESKKWFILLSTTFVRFLRKRMLPHRKIDMPDYIKPIKLSIRESAQIIKRSKITIDIPYKGQKGLSIRTLEALAANTKLVTTNMEVVKYDFYNENNICIIDRENPVIDKQFLEKPYQKIDNKTVEKYSIESWIRRIFESVR